MPRKPIGKETVSGMCRVKPNSSRYRNELCPNFLATNVREGKCKCAEYLLVL
jgi:hypothetical protein